MLIENNKVVTVFYELTLPTGEMADMADKERPFSFVHGGGHTIAGFDKNLQGLKTGERFDFIIKPEDAYGAYDEGLKVEIPISIFKTPDAPEDILQVGHTIPMQDPQGNTLYGVITAIHPEHVHMDFNHPLAGQSLRFQGTVQAVRDASDNEIALGEPSI